MARGSISRKASMATCRNRLDVMAWIAVAAEFFPTLPTPLSMMICARDRTCAPPTSFLDDHSREWLRMKGLHYVGFSD